MSAAGAIWELAPAAHRSHPLHDLGRHWPETNCYVDVWIELLAALGLRVEAALPFTIGCDFEGDQWTFFKPPHGDLQDLFGIRVEELTLWRPLLAHVETQVARRRLPLVEVDAFHLPDTQGTDYGRQHTKTTVGIAGVDPVARRLRYFHNRGFHELGGADFDGLFRIGVDDPPDRLPPYCEIVKIDALVRHEEGALRDRSLALARRHFAARPRENPVRAYERSLAEHLRWLRGAGLGPFHAYGFASVRQLGASCSRRTWRGSTRGRRAPSRGPPGASPRCRATPRRCCCGSPAAPPRAASRT